MQSCPEGGRRIRLREVLPEAELVGADDIEVAGCSRDSRQVQAGELFAALRGSRADGHDFAVQAAARGCTAILAQRPLRGVSVPVCYVPDSREAYGRVCQALAGNPSRQLKVVGVTGTNGKTTTTHLIASILSTAGLKPGLMGTLGCFDGEDFEPSPMTTAPPEILAGWLSRMAANGCSHAVMEVSSHALDQARIAGIGLDAACVTNVQRDHLDYHHSIRDYRLTKSRLLDYLAGDGFAVLNADDATSAAYLSRLAAPVLTIGIRSAAEITGVLLERCASEQTFLLSAGSENIPVRTRMIGTHHIYNCLMAAAVGLAYDLDLATVVRGLEAVQQVPGRLERLECGQPFSVFVDFAHTPDALTGCLQTLRDVTEGRLICVFGAGGDRDRQKRPLMGRAVEADADLAVITNDNPRTEDPQAIAQDILRGFSRPPAAAVILDRAEAIAWALSQAQPGDCVVIAGKGHEKYQIFGTRPIEFDDAEVARQWLYEVQPEGSLAGRADFSPPS
jgi:UDP-N-acetylmuramoyl-L-alanyl-D-glutamate--2,6-diaminopimelate ligase